MTASDLISKLNLLSHPEGGFYKETYRSEELVDKEALPDRFNASRHFATSIYFLLVDNNFSALHKIKSDETWHFYAGNTLEVIEIDAKGQLIITPLGSNVLNGEVFQYTVKAGHWFGSRVKKGGTFALVGCTVAPGFDFEDFEMATRVDLINQFPNHQHIIEEMTR